MSVLSDRPDRAVTIGRGPGETGHRPSLLLTTSPAPDDFAVVVAEGEIDAANAEAMGDYAVRAAHRGHRLLLDFSKVKFFGTAGFSALHHMNVRCAEAGVQWVMLPSPAVARVLRICDPEGVLPVRGTVEAGLAVLAGEAESLE